MSAPFELLRPEDIDYSQLKLNPTGDGAHWIDYGDRKKLRLQLDFTTIRFGVESWAGRPGNSGPPVKLESDTPKWLDPTDKLTTSGNLKTALFIESEFDDPKKTDIAKKQLAALVKLVDFIRTKLDIAPGDSFHFAAGDQPKIKCDIRYGTGDDTGMTFDQETLYGMRNRMDLRIIPQMHVQYDGKAVRASNRLKPLLKPIEGQAIIELQMVKKPSTKVFSDGGTATSWDMKTRLYSVFMEPRAVKKELTTYGSYFQCDAPLPPAKRAKVEH